MCFLSPNQAHAEKTWCHACASEGTDRPLYGLNERVKKSKRHTRAHHVLGLAVVAARVPDDAQPVQDLLQRRRHLLRARRTWHIWSEDPALVPHADLPCFIP